MPSDTVQLPLSSYIRNSTRSGSTHEGGGGFLKQYTCLIRFPQTG